MREAVAGNGEWYMTARCKPVCAVSVICKTEATMVKAIDSLVQQTQVGVPTVTW